MVPIQPYLMFNGNAAEALAFYSKALGGAVLFQQTYAEAPMESSPELKGKIMHATFRAGELTFMVSDANGQAVTGGNNLSLSLNFEDTESIEKTYAALAEGGKITMELQDTFWGARFGMLIDKFGFHWMFNHDKKEEK